MFFLLHHLYIYIYKHDSSRTPQYSKWNCVGTNRPQHMHMYDHIVCDGTLNTPKFRIVQKIIISATTKNRIRICYLISKKKTKPFELVSGGIVSASCVPSWVEIHVCGDFCSSPSSCAHRLLVLSSFPPTLRAAQCMSSKSFSRFIFLVPRLCIDCLHFVIKVLPGPDLFRNCRHILATLLCLKTCLLRSYHVFPHFFHETRCLVFFFFFF